MKSTTCGYPVDTEYLIETITVSALNVMNVERVMTLVSYTPVSHTAKSNGAQNQIGQLLFQLGSCFEVKAYG